MTKREWQMLMMLEEIDKKVSRQTWLRDFSSNVAGNAAWDIGVWLLRKLPRLFR